MNTGKEKSILKFWIAFAIITFVLSVTNMFGIEKIRTARKVSVIMDRADGKAKEQLEKGLSEEAVVQDFDLNIKYLAKSYDVEEQKSIISEEVENGAEALIIIPADEEEIKEWILEEKFNIPIVYMYSAHIARWWSINAGYDPLTVGADLADRISEDRKDPHIVLAARRPANTYMMNIAKALEDGIPGGSVEIKEYVSLADLSQQLRELIKNDEMAVLIGDDQEAAETIVKLTGFHKEWDNKIYSIGCDEDIIRKIENGKIEGAIGWSDYLVGVKVIKSLSNMFRALSCDYNIKVEHRFIDAAEIEERT